MRLVESKEYSSPASGPKLYRIHPAHSPKPQADPAEGRTGQSSPHLASINGAGAIEFGRFRLVLRSRELLVDGVPVPIGSRAVDVLLALIEARGELVTKDELLGRVWPNTIVEENNLQFQISTLRKALGKNREFIKTVSGRGYRFVAEATLSEPASRAVESEAAFDQGARPIAQLRDSPNDSPVPAAKPSLAVLPFANLSGDPKQDYFADSVAEDITNALSRFKSFSVIARNSSFVYKGRPVDVRQVSTDLGVRYVLEGSVRRAGDRLRISAELIDASSAVHLWADHFDGAAEDIFDVQDQITESVVGLIESHVLDAEIERSRRERPGSLQAYDLYLQAEAKFRNSNPAANAEAYAFLVKAIALEPDNGVFLADAARVVARALVMGWPPYTSDDRTTCINLARRSLANAGGDASILATCGLALIHAHSEFDFGLATLRRAVEANPNQFRVLMCAGIGHIHLGNLEDALAYLHRAMRLSPASPDACVALTGIAHVKLALGEYGEAVKWAEQSLALSSEYQPTYWMLIAAKAKLGLSEDAKRWRDRYLEIAPLATVALIRAAQPCNPRVETFLEGLRLAGLPES